MNSKKHDSLPAFARAVAEVSRTLTGFEATQTIKAGPIHVVARVSARRPERLAVEYRTYVNPLLDLEERLTGNAEYTADELVSLSLRFDGQRTWLHDPATGVCVVKPSRSLFEPLPEMSVLGEIEYLWDLPHDHLLRDLGTETIDGRSARRLSLRPKRAQSTHAFKTVRFLAREATVAFDQESLFPIRLSFSPSPFAQLHQLLGPEARVTVDYTDLRLAGDPPPAFEPPEGTRVFREEWVRADELADRLPLPISLAPFDVSGFTSLDGHAVLTACAEHGRSYAATTFVRAREGDAEGPQYVTVRFGNYLSRNMARRRRTIAEAGEELTVADRPARFLDRAILWDDQPEPLDRSDAPRELAWDQEGTFWFLTGVAVKRNDLEDLASRLIRTDNPHP